MRTGFLTSLAHRFDQPQVRAIALFGSYARGDAGLLSDVDLVRLFDERPPGLPAVMSHLVGDLLVVVSNVDTETVDTWFSEPDVASDVIAGVRIAQAVIDRDQDFERIQERARNFVWDEGMQQKANRWAGRQMVGWIEEVHKGLEGLRRDDTGRLLSARHGCSWGLSRVIQVQRGILLSGENAFYDEVAEAVGADTEWVRLRRRAFGVEDENSGRPSLKEQVIAGLRLYVLTARMLNGIMESDDEQKVKATARLIEMILPQHAA